MWQCYALIQSARRIGIAYCRPKKSPSVKKMHQIVPNKSRCKRTRISEHCCIGSSKNYPLRAKTICTWEIWWKNRSEASNVDGKATRCLWGRAITLNHKRSYMVMIYVKEKRSWMKIHRMHKQWKSFQNFPIFYDYFTVKTYFIISACFWESRSTFSAVNLGKITWILLYDVVKWEAIE